VALVISAVVGVVAVAAGSAPAPQTVTITASKCPGGSEFCFKAATLTVAPSTKVVWKNTTQAPHTVSRCTVAACGVSGGTGKDPKFDSPIINPGKTFALTFHGVGTYRYYCMVHGYAVMHGIITVRAKVVDPPTATTTQTTTTTTTTPYPMPYTMPSHSRA
jgi:plastocyanin